MADDEVKTSHNFLICINGQINSAFFPYFDDVYCKYCFAWGPDWTVVSGVEEGISQISKKGQDDEQLFIWNLPLSIVFKSTNPFGWPQLVVSAYGLDTFGNEVVRGYGVCHVPLTSGPSDKVMPMFVPESSSIIQKFTSWLTGRRPEFIDPKILTQGDAREEMAPDPHGTKSYDVCGYHGLELRPFSAPERPGKNPFSNDPLDLWKNFEELGVSKISAPVSPNYATYSSRLKSFENKWPIPEIQSPEKLAEAGFYYTLVQDNVLCFHCGGGLKNWEVDDDPWVEHAHWFSRCGFVILQKGRRFIKSVLAKVEGCPTSGAVTGEQEQQTSGSSSESTPVTRPAVEKKTEDGSTTTAVCEKERSSDSLGSDAKEIELCRICYTRERGIVFLPCGHFVSCPQCAPSLSTCAVCRKPFEATVRAYLS